MVQNGAWWPGLVPSALGTGKKWAQHTPKPCLPGGPSHLSLGTTRALSAPGPQGAILLGTAQHVLAARGINTVVTGCQTSPTEARACCSLHIHRQGRAPKVTRRCCQGSSELEDTLQTIQSTFCDGKLMEKMRPRQGQLLHQVTQQTVSTPHSPTRIYTKLILLQELCVDDLGPRLKIMPSLSKQTNEETNENMRCGEHRKQWTVRSQGGRESGGNSHLLLWIRVGQWLSTQTTLEEPLGGGADSNTEWPHCESLPCHFLWI